VRIEEVLWLLLWAGVGESLRSNVKRQDMLSEIDEAIPSSCGCSMRWLSDVPKIQYSSKAFSW
jgi:hypothetical protein